MIKVDFKALRLDVLNRQIAIENDHCNGCTFMDSSLHCPRRCEGCHFYTELRGIGDRLDELLKLEKVQREKKRMAFGMDVKEYKDLVAAGKTDKQIVALKQTTMATFYKWKRENGLVESRIKESEIPTKPVAPTPPVAVQSQQSSSELLREKKATITVNENVSDDLVKELKKQIKELNSAHLATITQHEKDMNELYERLKQANNANATLAFDVVTAQDALEKLRAEIGVTPNSVTNLKKLEEENALMREEVISLRKQMQDLSKSAAAATSNCDDSLVTELYAKIDLLNGQLARQATQLANGNTSVYVEMMEEEENFQTHLLRKLLSEREQRITLRKENKILAERVGAV